MSCSRNASIKIAKATLEKQGIQLSKVDDTEYDPSYSLAQSFLEEKQLSILSKYKDRLEKRNVKAESNKVNVDNAIHTYFTGMESDYASVSEEEMDNMVDAIILSEGLLIHISEYYPTDKVIVNKLPSNDDGQLINNYKKHQQELFSKYSSMFYIPYKQQAKKLLNTFRLSEREM